jgi:isocitrate lyase
MSPDKKAVAGKTIKILNRGKMKKRDYTQEDVKQLQGSLKIEYTLAKRGATSTTALAHSTEADQF